MIFLNNYFFILCDSCDHLKRQTSNCSFFLPNNLFRLCSVGRYSLIGFTLLFLSVFQKNSGRFGLYSNYVTENPPRFRHLKDTVQYCER